MNLFPLNNQSVWKELWLNQLENDPKETKKADHYKRWDNRAQVFDKHSATVQAVSRKERTLSMLKEAGALKPGSRVLDVGAGSGNWAISMAEMGANVVALEPSDGMVEILRQKETTRDLPRNRSESYSRHGRMWIWKPRDWPAGLTWSFPP